MTNWLGHKRGFNDKGVKKASACFVSFLHEGAICWNQQEALGFFRDELWDIGIVFSVLSLHAVKLNDSQKIEVCNV